MRKYFSLLFAGAAMLLVTSAAKGQDPVAVDSDHYKVEFENDQIRVLRITYGPHEKSVMHEHPANVAVFLTQDQVWRMTNRDGETEEVEAALGETGWAEAGAHLPENPTDNRQEVILVELKSPTEDSP
jgi:quercetin dioxygenase-like cupin family protein